MAELSKAQMVQVRIDLNAALKAVATKHGIDFSLGAIRFNDEILKTTLTGVNRSAVTTAGSSPVHPEELGLANAGKLILGADFDSNKTFKSPTLGAVKIVGYRARAHKFPFVVQQVNTGKRFKVTTLSAVSIAKVIA